MEISEAEWTRTQEELVRANERITALEGSQERTAEDLANHSHPYLEAATQTALGTAEAALSTAHESTQEAATTSAAVAEAVAAETVQESLADLTETIQQATEEAANSESSTNQTEVVTDQSEGENRAAPPAPEPRRRLRII